MELLLASHNPNKKREMQRVLPPPFILRDLHDLNVHEEIEESGTSLEENARIKARHLHDRLHMNCLAEDSGLEVDALHGAPGVFSARFAGPQKSDSDNIALLLQKMEMMEARAAQFRTVIVLILEDREYLFEGIIRGRIERKPAGNGGFGYDPVFTPEGYDKTFAELGDAIKTAISHRSIATRKLVHLLQHYAPDGKQ